MDKNLGVKAVQNILVPVDFSQHSKVALQQGVLLAKVFAAKLHVLHVFREKPNWADQIVTPITLGFSAKTFDLLLREAAQVMMKEFIEEAAPGNLEVESEIVHGEPVDEIAQRVRGGAVDLVVMGRRGESGADLPHLFLGSTADRVLRQAAAPVLVVPTDCLRTIDRIIVPVNFYEVCEDGMRNGLCWARTFGAKIIATHVPEAPLRFLARYALGTEANREKEPLKSIEKDARERLDHFLHSYREPEIAQGIEIESRVEFGEPWEVITDVAKSPSMGLVVMGSSGRHGLERFILGSVTEKVLKTSSSPILVVK